MENSENSSRKDILTFSGDERLRGQQAIEEAKQRYLKRAAPCPLCATPAEQLSWVYLIPSQWACQALCEKAGWMTVCNRCRLQIDFFEEVAT